MSESPSSLVITDVEDVTHAVMYANDKSFTRCRKTTINVILMGGSYTTFSKPIITCLRCIAEGGADG